MKLFDEFIRGHVHSDESFTKEEVMKLFREDTQLRDNAVFKIFGKEVTIATSNKGKTFSAAVFKNGNDSFTTMVDHYRVLDDEEAFAELVADFSLEKMQQFKKR